MKHRLAIQWLVAASVLCATVGGCQRTGGEELGAEGQLSVAVQALTGEDVADACYRLAVTDGDGEVVWLQNEVCGAAYGHEADISYVGTCDATSNDHTVTLELLSVYTAAGEVDPGDYVNPCPPGTGCSETVTCIENGDVQVPFDLTIMLQAELGFVDVSVDVEFLQCSAKLDCASPDGAPLEILHGPDGERGQTVVVAMSCLWDDCPDDGFFIYRDDITISCDEGTAIITPTGAGPAAFSQTADILYGAAVYAGEAASSGMYQNLAIGFDGGTNCSLSTSATVSPEPLPGQTIAEGSGHPAIGWSVPLTGAGGELACSQHPLNGEAPGVATFYPATADERAFDHEIVHATSCGDPSPPCAIDGEACDDGDPCTWGDSCSAGACIGILTVCDDGDPCSADFCDAALGGCYSVPDVDADGDGFLACDDCDDSDPTVSPATPEICGDGIDNDCDGAADNDCDGPCEDGFCDDFDPCTEDFCDPEVGCVFVPGPDMDGDGFLACEDCDDFDPEVSPAHPETCGDGLDNDCDAIIDEGCDACAGIDCNDGDPCTSDLCDPAAGCINVPLDEGASCVDTSLAASIIPNPSFESFSTCPTSHSQLSAADTWVQATDATSDYFVVGPACDDNWFVNGIGGELPPLNQGAADGDAFVGAIMQDAGYVEYVGACLDTPLLPGTEYTFEMQVAAPGPLSTESYGGDTLAEIVMLCLPDCGLLPLPGTDDKTDDFPVLATTTVNLIGGAGWSTASLTTVPTGACPAVIFGTTTNSTIQDGAIGNGCRSSWFRP